MTPYVTITATVFLLIHVPQIERGKNAKLESMMVQ